MSMKDLLILATTSGGIGIILSGALIFLSQFSEFIPYEWMYEEISRFRQIWSLIVAIAVFCGFLVCMGDIGCDDIFVVLRIFCCRSKKRILSLRGDLLKRKRATVPLNRVQSVRIIENPVRQFFGYAAVSIDNAGGGLGESAKINFFPLVKKADIYGPLQEIFPDLFVNHPSNKLPARGRRYYYRIDFFWMIPVVGALTYFFFPYGLLSLLLIPVIIFFGLWQHRFCSIWTFR